MKLSQLASCTLASACLVGLTGTAFGQNIISNGSFESEPSHVVTQTDGELGTDPSPIDWAFTRSDSGPHSWSESNNDTTRPMDPISHIRVDAEDGIWYISFGANNYNSQNGPTSENDYDSLSQTVQTDANTTYNLTYSLYELGGSGTAGDGTGDYFNVTWDGQVVNGTQVSGNQVTSGGWITFQTSILGDGGSHSIAFHGFSQRSYVNLDNVSLVAQSVPEPSAFAALGIGLVGLFIKRRK